MQKNTNTFIIVGQLTLVVGLLLYRFTNHTPIIDFLSGMCMGLSTVFNITAIIKAGPIIRKRLHD